MSSYNANVNMYRVGEYVYFEAGASSPYNIRKIEELLQTSNGCVEARVTIFYRRRDLPIHVLQNLDRVLHEKETDSESNDSESSMATRRRPHPARSPRSNPEQHQQDHVKLCELFASTYQEVLQAIHIRGKCHVVSLEEEVETRVEVASRENTFYFVRRYDPDRKALRHPGEKIRVGVRWQATLPELISLDDSAIEADRQYEVPFFLSSRVRPLSNVVDDFITIAIAVGLFARSAKDERLERSSCLLSSTARAYRGVTKERALAILHENDYNLAKAAAAIVADGNLLLCCDELEDWSSNDAIQFAQAFEKHGKAFSLMKKTTLSCKKITDIIGFYYFWKTTDHYAQVCQKQALTKTETKLKQVFIPQYSRINPSVLYTKVDCEFRPCDSCTVGTSPNWYNWGNAEDPCKLCRECWNYWKRFGGLPIKQESAVKVQSDLHLSNEMTSPGISRTSTPSPQIQDNRFIIPPSMNGKVKICQTTMAAARGGSSDSTDAFPCPHCKLVLRNNGVLTRHILMVHPEFATSEMKTTTPSIVNGTVSTTVLHVSDSQQKTNPNSNAKTNESCVPIFFKSLPWQRLGRRRVMTSQLRMNHPGRRPFVDIDPSGISVKEFTDHGLELWKKHPSPEIPSTHRRSALSVCDRLMASLKLVPLFTKFGDLFYEINFNEKNKPGNLKRVQNERFTEESQENGCINLDGSENHSSIDTSPTAATNCKRPRLEKEYPLSNGVTSNGRLSTPV